MGVGLVRSLQPPDILLIHCNNNWRVYNSIANTSKGVLFLPPSDVCQKLSLCLLYFNKTQLHKSSEWSSLVSGPRLNSSPLEAKNPGVFHGSATTFQWALWYSAKLGTTQSSHWTVQSNLLIRPRVTGNVTKLLWAMLDLPLWSSYCCFFFVLTTRSLWILFCQSGPEPGSTAVKAWVFPLDHWGIL